MPNVSRLLNLLRSDLRWAIESPKLLHDAVDPSELAPDHPFPKEVTTGHRVGYYFESLVDFWLREIRQVKVVARSHQLREGRRTIGEIDFIFRDEAGQLVHWEVAVKFYLCLGAETFGGSHFVGPNASDSLERKHDRLVQRQLPNGRLAFPELDRQETFVKGIIFHHPDEKERPSSPLLSADCQRGHWLRASEIERLGELGQDFGFLEKPHWFAAPEETSSLADTIDRLRAHFADSDRGQLLSYGRTAGRIFIVPDHWPEQTRAPESDSGRPAPRAPN